MGGAVCVIQGETVRVFDTPLSVGQYDPAAMSQLLQGLRGIALIESVHAMPKQGLSSTFNFGRGLGLWEGICAASGIEVTKVSPQKWKSGYPELQGLDRKAAKAKARELAARLKPELADSFKRARDDGRAEALLMALYLRGTTCDTSKAGESARPRSAGTAA